MSDNLTPTAQAILDTLRDHPATAADLREATGRGRSTVDKALTELAKAGHITKITPDGQDDGPTRWTLTPPHDSDTPNSGSPDPEPPGDNPSPSGPPADDAQHDDEPPPGHVTDEPDPTSAAPERHDADGNPDKDTGDTDGTATTEGDITGQPPDPQAQPGGQDPGPEPVKVCRGCGEQMPTICPTCGTKTAAYCGTCRKTHPTRRRTPGQSEILANGLPKLARGELERLVLDVIRTQPLPDHLGITGWTPGRVAIFLPGRSTGAIANALDKLATTGRTQLLGDNPKRYQPTPDSQPAGGDADEPHESSDHDPQQ